MSLADALERAASALPGDADAIRPANGDPLQLLDLLDADSSVRVLRWLLENDSDAGGELAARWAEVPEGAPRLGSVGEAGLPKAGRKALRRALHRLRSRGVEMAKTAATEPVVARLPKIDERIERAYVSPPDPLATRLCLLIESSPSGGVRIFNVVLGEAGVGDCEVFTAGRRGVRNLFKEIERSQEEGAVEVEPRALRALIARAARARSDEPVPRGFAEWRSHLTRDSEGVATPGETALAELGDVSRQDLERAVALVREHEVGPWPPRVERFRSLRDGVEERIASPIIVSGPQQRERLDEALAWAAEELYDESFGPRTAERFSEMAFVLWRRGREGDARACAAAARAFREVAPRDNPVAVALAEILAGPAPTAGAGEQEDESDEPSLLVKP